MDVSVNPATCEDERTHYLIQLAQIHTEHTPAFPLARITTCGKLTLEVLCSLRRYANGHLEPLYAPPDAPLLISKGTSTAFTLLALMVSQPDTFAMKDWLSEKLGHVREDEEDWAHQGLKRVDNVISRLRCLLLPLSPGEPAAVKQLRRHLVEYQRASSESGPGYLLAGWPLLWLDVTRLRCTSNGHVV